MFEKEVIDLSCLNADGFWGIVPSLELSVAQELHPKYLIGSVMGLSSGDRSAFHKFTKENIIPEYLDIWCAQTMALWDKDSPEAIGAGAQAICLDAKKVLDYHHVFYAYRLDGGEAPGTGIQGFCNVPVNTVW